MKKLIICILAISLMCLTSCSAIDEALEEANKLERLEDSMTLGNYEMKAEQYAIDTDENGRHLIKIIYKFKNNGEDGRSFYSAVNYYVYQNGIRLNEAADFDTVNEDTYIKSGASVNVEVVYELKDLATDVEVVFELGTYYGEQTDEKLTQYIKISEYFDESK